FLSRGANTRTPPAGMVRFGKLLPFWPFKAVVSGFPSCLKRSTLTVTLVVLVLAMTISLAQPPPATNSGSIAAPVPPTPADSVGKVPVNGVTTVIGIVLKFTPRNLTPLTEIGEFELITSVPVNSEGRGAVPEKVPGAGG